MGKDLNQGEHLRFSTACTENSVPDPWNFGTDPGIRISDLRLQILLLSSAKDRLN